MIKTVLCLIFAWKCFHYFFSWNINDKLLKQDLLQKINALSFYRSKPILDLSNEILDPSKNCFRQVQDRFLILIKFSRKISFLYLVYIETLVWTCPEQFGWVQNCFKPVCLSHFSLLFRTRHETLFLLWTDFSQIVKHFVPNMPFLVFNL